MGCRPRPAKGKKKSITTLPWIPGALSHYTRRGVPRIGYRTRYNAPQDANGDRGGDNYHPCVWPLAGHFDFQDMSRILTVEVQAMNEIILTHEKFVQMLFVLFAATVALAIVSIIALLSSYWIARFACSRDIQTRSLVITDDAGNTRIEIDADDGEPGMMIRDAAGQLKAMIAGFDDEPVIILYGADGRPAWTAPPTATTVCPDENKPGYMSVAHTACNAPHGTIGR